VPQEDLSRKGAKTQRKFLEARQRFASLREKHFHPSNLRLNYMLIYSRGIFKRGSQSVQMDSNFDEE